MDVDVQAIGLSRFGRGNGVIERRIATTVRVAVAVRRIHRDLQQHIVDSRGLQQLHHAVVIQIIAVEILEGIAVLGGSRGFHGLVRGGVHTAHGIVLHGGDARHLCGLILDSRVRSFIPWSRIRRVLRKWDDVGFVLRGFLQQLPFLIGILFGCLSTQLSAGMDVIIVRLRILSECSGGHAHH